ncbi:MAG: DUF4238 domain-containing protein [Bacteroidia bacterium]|nr:DUF4238 domain-containing protein [Bacteroidia bacterium]
MTPTNQDQHIIPRVYLKKFGYVNQNNQWMVSVLKRGENFSRQKSIEGFTIATNHFDIESEDIRIQRMFEQLNGELENEYNSIIDELIEGSKIIDKSCAMILQTIGNLTCRSDIWRNWVFGILNHANKRTFLMSILGHNATSFADLNSILERPHYRILLDLSPEQAINRVLLYFLEHLWIRLQHYEIVILKSQEQKPWFTSDNPVVLLNRTRRFECLCPESEIYFPLSPDYLVYIHYPGSNDKRNKMRSYQPNIIHEATDSQNEGLQKLIIRNSNQYVIVAGEFRYRNGEII